MKNTFRFSTTLPALLFLLLFMSSCEIIGDIFEAGAWTGAILLILLIVGVVWLFGRIFRR